MKIELPEQAAENRGDELFERKFYFQVVCGVPLCLCAGNEFADSFYPLLCRNGN